MVEKTNTVGAIAALTPLKILIVVEKEKTIISEPGRSFVRSIQRAFQGGQSWSQDGSEKYYAAGDELGVEVQTIFWSANPTSTPEPPTNTSTPNATDSTSNDGDPPTAARVHRMRPKNILKSCGHLFVVALMKNANGGDPSFKNWLNRVASLALEAGHEGRIGLLPIALDTESENSRLDQVDEFQRLPISDLGEYALRAGHLGLLVLQRAWSLLSDDSDGRMKLFISHAKKDGAAIARAMKSQIEDLKWLQRFYDACDILPGTPWRRVLRNGVRDSVIVILRTDIYEQRPWCVQESHWAEEFGCPTVIVDLRASPVMPRESLPVQGMVTVTISDGNLVRILNAALREAMRVQLFRHTIELLDAAKAVDCTQVVMVPRASLSSLGMVFENYLRGLQADGNSDQDVDKNIKWVVTPEPFRETLRIPAERLVRSYFPKAQLGIPRDII